MSTLQITLIVAASTAALICAVGTWKALKSSAGWRVWFLAAVARFYVRLMFSWRSNKPCPFPRDSPAIIIGNHTSPVDPILLWYNHDAGWPRHALRAIGFMVAKEYVDRKDPVGWICRAMESVPVKRSGRDMSAVKKAMDRLAEGKWLGIFPEGGINLTPEEGLRTANTGVAFISMKSGVPVYPAFIHNAPRGSSMVSCFLKRSRVRITYGEPIDLRKTFGDQKLNAETLAAATDILMAELTRLGEQRWFEDPT